MSTSRCIANCPRRSRRPHDLMTDPLTSQATPRQILLVDDEPHVLDSIRMLLELDRHVITPFRSAQDALNAFVPGKFDVVITDYQMPDMVGTDFAREIRLRASAQKIIMISAYTETITAGGKTLTDIDVILDKPFSLAMLRQALVKALAR